MAVKLSDIKAINWQFSIVSGGEVAEGIQDVRQCIQIILTTRKGSDPLRPLFGSDIYRHIDKPVDVAAALISAEILDALNKWETRIIIKKLVYTISGNRIDFDITAELLESGEATELTFYIDRQNQIEIPTIGRAFSEGFTIGFS